MEATLTEFLKSQDDLVREAALALPHQFSQCTYPLGPLRQAVYLCTTCPEARGICSACSIACHTNHEQVELFPKRNFRCDCPTTAIAHPCTLHTKVETENTLNKYGQNFRGVFCRCGRPYDATTEQEIMIQCLACEDWFHESCCNLRDRPSSRDTSPVQEASDNPSIDDNASDGSAPGLPPPLISGADYESFVCASCVFDDDLLKRWAGTPGVIVVVRDSVEKPWRLEQGLATREDMPDVQGTEPTPLSLNSKRPLSPSERSPERKRARTTGDTDLSSSSSTICLTPPMNAIVPKIYSSGLKAALDPTTSLGVGDIFLTEGFRNRWCHCYACSSSLNSQPYLLEEEDTYEPPEDPDSGLSLEELGLRALERIPRDRAIDGIHAFQEMRDDLMNFLKPFAQEGKVVNEADVRGFFASLTGSSGRAGS